MPFHETSLLYLAASSFLFFLPFPLPFPLLLPPLLPLPFPLPTFFLSFFRFITASLCLFSSSFSRDFFEGYYTESSSLTSQSSGQTSLPTERRRFLYRYHSVGSTESRKGGTAGKVGRHDGGEPVSCSVRCTNIRRHRTRIVTVVYVAGTHKCRCSRTTYTHRHPEKSKGYVTRTSK